ncbi:hypothetical protein [Methylotuvimicrobium sp.]|uniref:hypothetical protein n=1 Tax=Methylotuvimicrobium sp. TaxID=2822413 RepID=UPI003D65EBA0
MALCTWLLRIENDKTGYTDVISEALKRLEIEMTPAGAKSMMRYGLLYLNNEGKNERR